eukprot:COSAG05_NODE_348_length_10944_cov_10.258368_2_plen_62_part_00
MAALRLRTTLSLMKSNAAATYLANDAAHDYRGTIRLARAVEIRRSTRVLVLIPALSADQPA